MTREQQITVVKEMISEAVADGSMTKRCATAIMNAYDAILALPIEVPRDKEIENKANGIANPKSQRDFERWQWLGVKEGARWMRDEIIKRNRP